jgi:gamma-glutamylcyclotransferase (GGCT)/AIG2-like uncharacterized protein YtfP
MLKAFVYGTLMSINTNIMENLGCHGPVRARLEGYALYQVAPDFPGIVPEPGGVVLGELWEVPEPAVAALDYYEGVEASLYRREEAEVEADGGRKEKAFVYVWNREPRGRKVPLDEQPWRLPEWEDDEDWEDEDSNEG